MFVMSFATKSWREDGVLPGTVVLMQRATSFLNELLLESNIDCNRMSFQEFNTLVDRNINNMFTMPPPGHWPEFRRMLDLKLQDKRKATLLVFLKQNPENIRIVDVFSYYPRFSFASTYLELPQEEKVKYQDTMNAIGASMNAMGTFLRRSIFPPTYDRLLLAAAQAVTDACAYLPGSLDAKTVSVDTFNQQMEAYLTPETLPPVPRDRLASKMYKNVERKTFLRALLPGTVPTMESNIIHIFYNPQFPEMERIFQILSTFTDPTVERSSLDPNTLVQVAIQTCKKACQSINARRSANYIDYRTVSGRVFLQEFDRPSIFKRRKIDSA